MHEVLGIRAGEVNNEPEPKKQALPNTIYSLWREQLSTITEPDNCHRMPGLTTILNSKARSGTYAHATPGGS